MFFNGPQSGQSDRIVDDELFLEGNSLKCLQVIVNKIVNRKQNVLHILTADGECGFQKIKLLKKKSENIT